MTTPTAPMSVDDLPKFFSYDPSTGEVLRIGPRINRPQGHISTGGYIYHDACGRKLYAHRVAWAMTHGVWPKNVDHINGDRTDNRIDNLRPATPSQNNRNARARVSASKLKGVLLRRGRYIVRINVHTQRHELGAFRCPIAAALAYDRAATYFFGEFAMTNFELGLLEASEANHG